MDKRKKTQVNNAIAIKALGQMLVHMNDTLQERDRVFAMHIASVISFLKEVHPELTDVNGETVDLYKKFVDKMNAAPVLQKKADLVVNDEKFELDITGIDKE